MSGMDGMDGLGGGVPTAFDFVSGAAAYHASKRGQKRANRESRDSSREQMRFQERMSSSAYQRSKADMLAAGLNPILMTTQGGASAPAGASYKAESTTKEATTSAMSAIRIRAELANLNAQNSKLIAETSAIDAKSAPDKMKQKIYETGKDVVDSTLGTGKKVFEDLKDKYYTNAKPSNPQNKRNVNFPTPGWGKKYFNKGK